MFCENCGAELSGGSGFCEKCGSFALNSSAKKNRLPKRYKAPLSPISLTAGVFSILWFFLFFLLPIFYIHAIGAMSIYESIQFDVAYVYQGENIETLSGKWFFLLISGVPFSMLSLIAGILSLSGRVRAACGCITLSAILIVAPLILYFGIFLPWEYPWNFLTTAGKFAFLLLLISIVLMWISYQKALKNYRSSQNALNTENK